MSPRERVQKLQQELSERDDWRARYWKLRLERLGALAHLVPDRVASELEQAVADLKETEENTAKSSPYAALLKALDPQLRSRLSYDDYHRLQEALDCPGERAAAWTTLLNLARPSSPGPVEIPTVRAPKPTQQKATRQRLRALILLESAAASMSAAELRAARWTILEATRGGRRALSRLKDLIARLEALPPEQVPEDDAGTS